MMSEVVSPSRCPDPAIWCGIPVYNNASTIVDIARRCLLQVANVVVVDDGSTDADLRTLLAGTGAHVVRHPTNLGKGAALRSAFQYAAERGAKYLISLDGDGQHFPEDIPRFFIALAPDTILTGYRHEVTGVMPRSSRFGRDFSDFWICVETGRMVHDTQSGFRAYPLPAVMALKLDARHYNFEMEIVTKAIWAGMQAQTVLIRVWYPPKELRVSSFKAFEDNLRISLLHTKLVTRQLLPLPHQRLFETSGSRGTARSLAFQNSSPIGLAVAVGLSILIGVLIWPYGALLTVYIAIRLHLNKIAMLIGIVLSTPPAVAGFCRMMGHWVIGNNARPGLEWFVGSHIVAFSLAAVSIWLIYRVARHFNSRRLGAEP